MGDPVRELAYGFCRRCDNQVKSDFLSASTFESRQVGHGGKRTTELTVNVKTFK